MASGGIAPDAEGTCAGVGAEANTAGASIGSDAIELLVEGFDTDSEGGAVSVGAAGSGCEALPAGGGFHLSLKFVGLGPSVDPGAAAAAAAPPLVL